jgi:hypothetical protein
MPTDQELFDELSFYTLSLRDPFFLHQNAVDAFAAQHVDTDTKPIKTVFALIGLYLTLEKGFTGRQVQLAHMRLARQRKLWPEICPTQESTPTTIAEVLCAEPGPPRDQAIRNWCQAVWQTWQPQREIIVKLAQEELDIQ